MRLCALALADSESVEQQFANWAIVASQVPLIDACLAVHLSLSHFVLFSVNCFKAICFTQIDEHEKMLRHFDSEVTMIF